jgi:hypothetical protein
MCESDLSGNPATKRAGSIAGVKHRQHSTIDFVAGMLPTVSAAE